MKYIRATAVASLTTIVVSLVALTQHIWGDVLMTQAEAILIATTAHLASSLGLAMILAMSMKGDGK